VEEDTPALRALRAANVPHQVVDVTTPSEGADAADAAAGRR